MSKVILLLQLPRGEHGCETAVAAGSLQHIHARVVSKDFANPITGYVSSSSVVASSNSLIQKAKLNAQDGAENAGRGENFPFPPLTFIYRKLPILRRTFNFLGRRSASFKRELLLFTFLFRNREKSTKFQ